MLIGELAQQSQFSRDTIRYYEKLGLLAVSQTRRAENNYKHYPQATLDRLLQIQLLKESGFTLCEIQSLLLNNGKQPSCAGLPAQLTEKIAAIEKKITTLLKFKDALLQIQQACNGGCGTNNGMPDCVEQKGKDKPSPPSCC